MTTLRFNLMGALLYGTAFVSLVLKYRFEVPRFDYWDIVFFSTDVTPTNLVSLSGYLFEPSTEAMMVLPKLFVYLSNAVGGMNVFMVELTVTLLLGTISHGLLLRILGLPLVPGNDTTSKKLWQWWLVLALFWWPAVLPTYTNTWFAIQYGLTLFFSLFAIALYLNPDRNRYRLFLSYLLWLCAAATHSTGLILGPALALIAAFRDRRHLFALLMAVSTGLLVWVQHGITRGYLDSALSLGSPTSMASVKFLLRVITPPMWETALFVLIILPLLLATAWLCLNHYRVFIVKPYVLLLAWGLAVWVATWIGRGGFQDHANPHYLRFYVLLYIAWAMMLFDFGRLLWGGRILRYVTLILFSVIWIKGFERGVSLAAEFHDRTSAGAAVLRGESSDGALLLNLYPDTERLTGKLLPRLVNTPGYVYGNLVGQGQASDPKPVDIDD